MDRKLSIAILGSRGIPNKYGGFEEFAQELGLRLVKKGHDLTVYTSHCHPEKSKEWNRIQRKLVYNPERSLGPFGQFIYDLKSNLHSRKQKFDVVLHLGYTSDSVWHWLWTSKSVHIVNIDGEEWKRSKYSPAVQKFLKYAEKLAVLHADEIIADSMPMKAYIEGKYGKEAHYISYGAYIPEAFSVTIPRGYSLQVNRYDLIVARMEPENNIETAIEAKLGSGDGIPLVIVGNDNRYKSKLKEKYPVSGSIMFLDAVFEKGLINNLRHFCRLYIHGHSVGGTNPSLLEAMACGCRISAHDNKFNRAVLEENALYFTDAEALKEIFRNFDPGNIPEMIENNIVAVRSRHNWEHIANEYEKLFLESISS